ncbi:ABC transporter substrate-binding protein [Endozoicomonas numazuensis]|uniref:ABC transporter substrate-binding protein n=1 Tax=Endozoicomonas numazuensis TaxID=1137799 RepID=UPI00068D530F|nr:ABC transporter substrate-binding protein [Endozoicomonas numazuensis]
MHKAIRTLGATLLLSVSSTAVLANTCGKLSIADMNWDSATLLAHVDQFILNQGYGCDAELVPGDSMPTSTSMIEKGEPDIAPELWTIFIRDALDKGVEEKRLRIAGTSLSDGGEEGFWVPQYMVDKDPSLATIQGIIKNASLFKHPEEPDVAGFYGCPAGWTCEITVSNLFRAMKLEEKGFEMIDPGSGAALSASLARAYDRKEPWFGYYWSPTPALGKYDMVKVDFGSGVDNNEYKNCTTQVDCENPKVTMYPPLPVHSVTTESFASKAPEAYQYIQQRSLSNADMNKLLAWMEDNQADGEMAMEHFLKNYPQIWQTWVSEAAATKIKKALSRLSLSRLFITPLRKKNYG